MDDLLDYTGWATDGNGQYGVTFDPATDLAVSSALATSDYLSTLEQIAPGISTRVDAAQQPGESWVSALTRVIPSLALTVQQAQLLNVQTQRAKAGLPPLNASQYGLGVSVGASPQITTILMLGVGLVAFMAMSKGR